MESCTPANSLEFCDYSHLQTVSPDVIEGLLFVRVGTIYGGYDPEFFQENMEEHFVCPICKGILSCPTLIVECGHVFCEKCIQENNRHFRGETRTPKCPMDNIALQTDLIQERFLRRYLLQKYVFCPLKKRGCTWEGELSEINQHTKNCLYLREICDSGCGSVLFRKDMASHSRELCPNRKLKCRYCKDEFLFREVDEHNKECCYFPVQCINQCGTYLERKNLNYHLETDCPETSIECCYAKYGCDFRSPRKGMSEHMKHRLDHHLGCILHYTCNLEKMCVNLHSKYSQLEERLEFVCKLTSVSPEEYPMYPGSQRAKQCLRNEYNHMDDVPALPDICSGSFADPSPYNSSCSGTPTASNSEALAELRMCCAQNTLTNSTGEGAVSFTWHIYEVEDKMQNEEEVFSDAFYSGPEGYKFCLSADMNGYESGEGTHLSVFIHMMKGSNDNNLTWPFKGKFTVTLLNQIENDRHHSIEIQAGEANINAFRCPEQSRGSHGWGSHEFISHEELKTVSLNCQYLKEDSIHIRVTADPEAKLPFWLW